jgi:putative transposase
MVTVYEAMGYLLSCGRYIERNPVEAGLVVEPWAYPWSSCQAYTLGEPNRLLATNPWYDQLAVRSNRRRQLWREFLLGEDPKEEVVLRQDWATGGERFRADAAQARSRAVPRGRGRRRKQ